MVLAVAKIRWFPRGVSRFLLHTEQSWWGFLFNRPVSRGGGLLFLVAGGGGY